MTQNTMEEKWKETLESTINKLGGQDCNHSYGELKEILTSFLLSEKQISYQEGYEAGKGDANLSWLKQIEPEVEKAKEKWFQEGFKKAMEEVKIKQ